MAEMHVAIDGTVTTATSSTGVGGTAGNPGFVSVVQGGNTALVTNPGPNVGSALFVSSGSQNAVTSFAAVSATGAGTVADFGAAKSNITMAITASAGVSAGAVALEVSHDSTNWFRATPVTQSAPGVTQVNQAGAWRYARGNVTTAITGGTVSATLMGA